MIDVTNQDFLPHNIILEFEQCQETIFDDTNDPYFDRTDQQPFESIAGKYAYNSYGIDVFILPNDFLHTEQGGGGTVGGSTALTIPSKVLFLYGKTNCAYPSLFAYQNNIAQHFASVPHVLSHELGHCLGLIHTHDASNFTPAPNLYFCVNADCNWVATTVPAYCVAFQTNPVTIDPANQPNNGNPPFLENIMAYTNYFDCAPTFTTWQGELMRLYLSTHPLLSKIGHQVLGDLTITGTESWSPSNFFPFGNVVVNGSVDIQNGGTLNIMPGVKIRFREEDLILVRPGGSFSNQGILSSKCCSYWQGVKVLGAPFPAVVGLYTGYNGSRIENAKTGLHSLDGGILNVSFSSFYNNGIGAKLSPNYQQPANSLFYDCSFVNRAIRTMFGVDPADYIPRSHIEIDRYISNATSSNFLKITQCEFENIGTSNDPFYNARQGIYAGGGIFEVDNSLFKGLKLGIRTVNAGSKNIAYINNNTFSACQLGYLGDNFPVRLSGNTFELGHFTPDGPDTDIPDPELVNVQDQFGIFVRGNTPVFVCQKNEFNFVPLFPGHLPAHYMIGSYVQNIGTYNHYLYRNTYNRIDYANIADGVNAIFNLNTSSGLHYLCNENIAPQLYDFSVTEDGMIRREQGRSNPNFPIEFGPSGNYFSHSNLSNNFDDFNNQGQFIKYYYSIADILQEPISFYGLNKLLLLIPENCFGRLEFEDLDEQTFEHINQENLFYQSNDSVFHIKKIDYLSELEVGDSFSINHSFNLMNAYREQLDCSLSKILHKQLATNTIDSIAIWLTCLDKIDAYFPLVRMFTELDNLAASDSILQTIEYNYQLTELQANELNSIQLLLDILEEVNLIEINTPTVSLLQNFEITAIGFAKEWTRNILYEYGTYFSLNYELPSEIQARGGGNFRNYRHLKSQMSSVTVFPNPVDNKVIIFINDSLPTNYIFNVKNSYGLEVFHQILSPDQQILEIQTYHW